MSANVKFTDDNLAIVPANHAVHEILRSSDADPKAIMPHFDIVALPAVDAAIVPAIKNWANQAESGTYKILPTIDDLNDISGYVVGRHGAIKHVVHAAGQYVTSTAAVVEEQSTVSNEMSAGIRCVMA